MHQLPDKYVYEFTYDPDKDINLTLGELSVARRCTILTAAEILEREYGVSMEDKRVDSKIAKAIHEQIFSKIVYGNDGAFHMTFR